MATDTLLTEIGTGVSEQGETRPSHVYIDPDVFAGESERSYARAWQYVGHVEKVRTTGDFFVADVAGESIIVVRGNEGDLHAYYDVCARRAARVAQGEWCRKSFSCPYHGWTYDLKGALVAAPNTANVPDFRLSAHRLKSCRVEEIHGLIFVNLDRDAVSLADLAPGLEDELREYAPGLPNLTFVHRTESRLKCNWKIAVENYSECYHCTLVHKSFVQGVVNPESYRVRVHGLWQKHLSRSRTGTNKAYDFDHTARPHASEFGAWWMWPNFAFQTYPGNAVHVWKWTPLSVDRTHVTVDWFMPTVELEPWQRELIAHHAATTFAEDIPLVESVQQGVASCAYERGPLMIDEGLTQYSEHAGGAIQSLWRGTMEAG